MPSNSASKKISILGNVTWEGGCVIYLTQHNCLIWKLHSKSWLVLMNSCIWFRGEILGTFLKKKKKEKIKENKRKKKERPLKNKRALDKRSVIVNILIGCLSCVSKGPLFTLDAWALALMMKCWWLAGKLLPPHSPSMRNMLFVRAFHKWLVLGTRYKKMLENTLKRHVLQSDLCTVSALQESLPTTFMFLPWHYSSTKLYGL